MDLVHGNLPLPPLPPPPRPSQPITIENRKAVEAKGHGGAGVIQEPPGNEKRKSLLENRPANRIRTTSTAVSKVMTKRMSNLWGSSKVDTVSTKVPDIISKNPDLKEMLGGVVDLQKRNFDNGEKREGIVAVRSDMGKTTNLQTLTGKNKNIEKAKDKQHQKLLKDMDKIEKSIAPYLNDLKKIAEESETGSMTLKKNCKEVSGFSAKYGLTVTKEGDVYVHIPKSIFAAGGQKEVKVAIKLETHEVIARGITAGGDEDKPLDSVAGDQMIMKIIKKSGENENVGTIHAVTSNNSKGGQVLNGTLGSFFSGGDLEGKVFDKKEFATHACGAARGLAFLHENGIAYRDTKPENMMLDKREGGTVKIVDFGTVIDMEGIMAHMRSDLLLTEKKSVTSLGRLNNLISSLPKGELKKANSWINDIPKIEDGELLGVLKNGLEGFNTHIATLDSKEKPLSAEDKKELETFKNAKRQIEKAIKGITRDTDGTPQYLSPEVTGLHYSDELRPSEFSNPLEFIQKRDVYSLGVSFYEMQNQIAGDTLDERAKNLMAGVKAFKDRDPVNDTATEKFIRTMLNDDPDERPTMKEVSKFFNGKVKE